VWTFKAKGKLSSDVGTGNTSYSKKCRIRLRITFLRVLHILACAKNTLWALHVSLSVAFLPRERTICKTGVHLRNNGSSVHISERTTRGHCWNTMLRKYGLGHHQLKNGPRGNNDFGSLQQRPTFCGVNTSGKSVYSKQHTLQSCQDQCPPCQNVAVM
jgi:hypothetical protein